MLVVLTGCDWSQFGFDAAHSGWNPTEQTITPGNVGTLTARWIGVGRQPVVGAGLVFSLHSDGLQAQDTVTGALRWKRSPPPSENGGFRAPVVSDGTVYVAGNHGTGPSDQSTTLHAYDAANGNERWSVPVPGCPATFFSRVAPTVSDRLVVIADLHNGICAVDAKTGAQVWSVGLPGLHPVGGDVSVVAIADGRVFAYGWNTMNGVTVFALNERTGATLWSRTAPGFPWGAPVVADGRLFIPAGTLSTFDAATGTPGWTAPSMYITDVAVSGDAVAAVGPGSNDPPSGQEPAIRRLNPSTGAALWSIIGPASTHYSKPAIANGVVFVSSFIEQLSRDSAYFCCAHMSALDLGTGGELFSIPTRQAGGGDDVYVDYPVVSGGTVYVGQFASTAPFPGGAALRPTGS
jgi:outer membrane protein assembly factor BamB